MTKIQDYKLLALQEVDKRLPLLPKNNGTKESMLQLLDAAGKTVTELDQALLLLARNFASQHELSEEETNCIYEINAASLAALLLKSDVPGHY